MRRPIILSIILLIGIAYVTVLYFRNLSPPGTQRTAVLNAIPADAALTFEFNNEKSFYEIFDNNQLFAAVIGGEQLSELDTLRRQLLEQPALKAFFDGQSIFVSFHPAKDKSHDVLITTSATKNFDALVFERLPKQSGLTIKAGKSGDVKTYDIYLAALKKHFYMAGKEKGVYGGSFSKEITDAFMRYTPKKNEQNFILLPERQTANSLANLYVNYKQLNPLFEALLQNKYSDIFKSFRVFPALGVLDLNYKSDALMFSGFTETYPKNASSYLSLFINQQPVPNTLQNVFPSTTAYSINFAVSDAKKFKTDLSQWQAKAGLQHEKDSLFNKVKIETGVNLIPEFNRSLGKEFGVVTTRYMEKLAIVMLQDAALLKPIMSNISTMDGENTGQFNYSKLPFFLLGDAFSMFNKPWFMIIDNYLILATSKNELNSYRDSYFNRKFQGGSESYTNFNALLTERSNVSYYINFKNSQSVLKRDLNSTTYHEFENNKPGWKDFYAASYQLSAAGKNFYTVFGMKLNAADTTAVK